MLLISRCAMKRQTQWHLAHGVSLSWRSYWRKCSRCLRLRHIRWRNAIAEWHLDHQVKFDYHNAQQTQSILSFPYRQLCTAAEWSTTEVKPASLMPNWMQYVYVYFGKIRLIILRQNSCFLLSWTTQHRMEPGPRFMKRRNLRNDGFHATSGVNDAIFVS